MNICKKCNSEFEGNYCPNCGHPQKLERINGHYILSEITSVLNFQKGILFTIKELLLRPGQNIKVFISEDRNRLVKPILFVLITSLIYAISVKTFHFRDGYFNFNIDDLQGSSLGIIFQWIKNHYGYFNIIMAVFIAIWIKIFFRKFNYNYYEILVLLCFIMGVEMLLLSLLGMIDSLTELKILKSSAIIYYFYGVWAIGQFFGKKKIINYVKGFLSYLLGMLTCVFILMGIGRLIDLI